MREQTDMQNGRQVDRHLKYIPVFGEGGGSQTLVAKMGEEIALQLFTVLGVCFITSVDINLFSFGKAKTGTKLIGIWRSRKKKSQFVIPFMTQMANNRFLPFM